MATSLTGFKLTSPSRTPSPLCHHKCYKRSFARLFGFHLQIGYGKCEETNEEYASEETSDKLDAELGKQPTKDGVSAAMYLEEMYGFPNTMIQDSNNEDSRVFCASLNAKPSHPSRFYSCVLPLSHG